MKDGRAGDSADLIGRGGPRFGAVAVLPISGPTVAGYNANKKIPGGFPPGIAFALGED